MIKTFNDAVYTLIATNIYPDDHEVAIFGRHVDEDEAIRIGADGACWQIAYYEDGEMQRNEGDEFFSSAEELCKYIINDIGPDVSNGGENAHWYAWYDLAEDKLNEIAEVYVKMHLIIECWDDGKGFRTGGMVDVYDDADPIKIYPGESCDNLRDENDMSWVDEYNNPFRGVCDDARVTESFEIAGTKIVLEESECWASRSDKFCELLEAAKAADAAYADTDDDE